MKQKKKKDRREIGLKGVRYASVGVGPDWARVWTLPVGREKQTKQTVDREKRE